MREADVAEASAAVAAAAGMSERPVREWQSGALPATLKAQRTWRTQEDLFAGVWESEVGSQLVTDTDSRLQVPKLFSWLCRRHQGRSQPGQPGRCSGRSPRTADVSVSTLSSGPAESLDLALLDSRSVDIRPVRVVPVACGVSGCWC